MCRQASTSKDVAQDAQAQASGEKDMGDDKGNKSKGTSRGEEGKGEGQDNKGKGEGRRRRGKHDRGQRTVQAGLLQAPGSQRWVVGGASVHCLYLRMLPLLSLYPFLTLPLPLHVQRSPLPCTALATPQPWCFRCHYLCMQTPTALMTKVMGTGLPPPAPARVPRCPAARRVPLGPGGAR